MDRTSTYQALFALKYQLRRYHQSMRDIECAITTGESPQDAAKWALEIPEIQNIINELEDQISQLQATLKT